MSTVLGYFRTGKRDEWKPDALAADLAALAAAQAEHAGRGFAVGEVVTDGNDQWQTPAAARPGVFRVGQLAERGDVILLPTAGRLARSVVELRDTLEQWLGRGVTGVVLDLKLDYAQPEARAALKLMAAGATLDRSLMKTDNLLGRTADQNATVNRFGLFISPKTKKASIVPAEFDLAAKCAGWKCAGASHEQIALHLTRTREPLPKRWHGRNRTFMAPSPFWKERQVRRMVRSYFAVSGLYARGACKAPAGYDPPVAVPTPLPERN